MGIFQDILDKISSSVYGLAAIQKKQVVEEIYFESDLTDTGNLAGGEIISATSKPGAANYTHGFSIPSMAAVDARLIQDVIGTLFEHSGLSIGVNAHLYVEAYVNDATGLDPNFQLFSEDIAGGGGGAAFSGKIPLNVDAVLKPTLFPVLCSGSGQLYFFIWVDAGTAVLNQCQEKGSNAVAGEIDTQFFHLNYDGLVEINGSAVSTGVFHFCNICDSLLVGILFDLTTSLPIGMHLIHGLAGYSSNSTPMAISYIEFLDFVLLGGKV